MALVPFQVTSQLPLSLTYVLFPTRFNIAAVSFRVRGAPLRRCTITQFPRFGKIRDSRRAGSELEFNPPTRTCTLHDRHMWICLPVPVSRLKITLPQAVRCLVELTHACGEVTLLSLPCAYMKSNKFRGSSLLYVNKL